MSIRLTRSWGEPRNYSRLGDKVVVPMFILELPPLLF